MRKANLLMVKGLVAAGLLPFLTACDQMGSGQVVASVNGEEITIQEVNAELRSVRSLQTLDADSARKAAVGRIVDRRLMAQAAREQGLDETPYFLLREKQLRDALLAQLLRQSTEQSLNAPSQSTIDSYIDDNPALFAKRKIIAIEQITFSVPSEAIELKGIEQAENLDDVEVELERLEIPYQRVNRQLDSLDLGSEQTQEILGLPAGKPFVLPQSSDVMIGVVKSVSAAPVSKEAAKPLASAAILEDQLNSSLSEILSELRNDANVEYREDFLPTPLSATARIKLDSAPEANSGS